MGATARSTQRRRTSRSLCSGHVARSSSWMAARCGRFMMSTSGRCSEFPISAASRPTRPWSRWRGHPSSPGHGHSLEPRTQRPRVRCCCSRASRSSRSSSVMMHVLGDLRTQSVLHSPVAVGQRVQNLSSVHASIALAWKSGQAGSGQQWRHAVWRQRLGLALGTAWAGAGVWRRRPRRHPGRLQIGERTQGPPCRWCWQSSCSLQRPSLRSCCTGASGGRP
mmetsp:Transcript_20083/g.55294  ORF Transcript_20083/g.55294 Transcript_20083/m.55294 type:complete len:222 (-) Transcript_20083:246-911(-)